MFASALLDCVLSALVLDVLGQQKASLTSKSTLMKRRALRRNKAVRIAINKFWKASLMINCGVFSFLFCAGN